MFKLYDRFQKIDWQSGVAEAVSFAVLLPIFVFIVLMVFTVTDFGLVKQKTEYVGFSCARAASIQVNANLADQKSKTLYKANMNVNTKQSLLFADESTAKTTEFQVVSASAVFSNEDVSTRSDDMWLEGNFIIHRTYVYYDPLFPFMREQLLESAIIMMIESSQGGR